MQISFYTALAMTKINTDFKYGVKQLTVPVPLSMEEHQANRLLNRFVKSFLTGIAFNEQEQEIVDGHVEVTDRPAGNNVIIDLSALTPLEYALLAQCHEFISGY